MAGILIDTSVLVGAERDRKVLEQLPQDARHSISVITVSELLHGVHRAAAPDDGGKAQWLLSSLAINRMQQHLHQPLVEVAIIRPLLVRACD